MVLNTFNYCEPLPPSIYKMFSFFQSETLYSLNKNSSHFCSLSPWQPGFYFLSKFDYFWVSHLSGVIHYSSFCNWLISLSTMFSRLITLKYVLEIHFFLKLNNISLYVLSHFKKSIHLLIDIWVAFTFWLLWIMLLWTLIYKYLFMPLLSILLGVYPEVKLLDHMGLLFMLPRWLSGKEFTCQWRGCRRNGLNPWVWEIPWRGKWQSTPVFLAGKSHGQKSLKGYSQGVSENWTRLSSHAWLFYI